MSVVREPISRETAEWLCSVDVRAPLPPVIAVGAHLKNTVAVSEGSRVYISRPNGDLETPQAFETFKRTVDGLLLAYSTQKPVIACDLHPDYLSTQYAESTGLPLVRVQHHYAHALACMADNGVDAPVLGVSWDGTGYGTDGTVWGGEFLRVDDVGFTRAAHLRAFALPGGERAVREPRRSALGLLYKMYGEGLFDMRETAPLQAFSAMEVGVLRMMLSRHINTPITSSAGRLFDAAAAVIGLRQKSDFEGQAAVELEAALSGIETDERYDFEIITTGGDTVIDWALMMQDMLDDWRSQVPIGVMAVRFHNTLVEIIVAAARYVGEERVILSGGCFLNRYLTERTMRRLADEGFRPYRHQRVPTGDAGIALGQVMAAARELRRQ